MGYQSTLNCAKYCKFYSCWQYQKCCLITFSYFLFVNVVGLHLGELRRKQAKKSVYNPADLEAVLPEIQGGVAKKAAARMYNIPRSTVQF
jgi:hypothetical protein